LIKEKHGIRGREKMRKKEMKRGTKRERGRKYQ